MGITTARQHPRIADNGSLAPESELSKSLFKTRYLKEFDAGMKLTPSSIDRLIQYQPINGHCMIEKNQKALRPGRSGSMTSFSSKPVHPVG